MNFYISKIRLWFRHGGEPRDLDFFKDKVNVITGDSSTGKSSVLKIIDYCLLSERSTIVEDVINENVAWYGLVFCVEDKPYTIIRQAPTVESAEMKVIFREGEYLPEEPVAALNDIRSKVVVKMNELFHINSKLKLESKVKPQFRHNLVFNYLTEDIIATENTYQDLRFFRKDEYARVLNDLFKIAIGVNEGKIRALESELKTAQTKEKNQKEAQRREADNLDKFEKTKVEIANEIEELGLGAATDFGDNPMAWAENVRVIVENCSLQFKDEQANVRRQQIEKELYETREKLGYFISLENEYKTYQKRLARQDESLAPLDFVKKHLSELMTYQETGRLLRELSDAWTAIKQSYVPEMKLPERFEETKKELEKQERQLRQEYGKLNPYKDDQRNYVWIRKAILLAERMEKELAKIPKMTISDESIIQCGEAISQIEEKLVRLRVKNDNALGNLNDAIEKYFKYQHGISEAYRDYKPVYSMEEKMNEKAYELLRVFDLDQDADSVLASNLPYGAQRKLEIARAMATNPKLLLLDEPAAGMNPNETQELMDTIRLIRDQFGMTILLIEHDMKLVGGICEKLTVLNFGRILTSGDTRTVLSDPEVIKAYLGE